MADIVRRVQGRLHRPANGGFRPGPDETMLVSYPRSGNTWIRFVLGNVLAKSFDTDFVNLEGRIPDIYVSTPREIRRTSSPRLVKSHEPYTPTYRRVVYIARDPCDVAPSYYRYLRRAGFVDHSVTLETFIEQFAGGDSGWDVYGGWERHVRGWVDSRGDEDFLLVRYEDLVQQPQAEIRRISAFCRLDATDEIVRLALDAASPERMRRKESEQASKSRALAFRASAVPFVGPARVGAGREQLDEDLVRLLDSKLGEAMRLLGYPG